MKNLNNKNYMENIYDVIYAPEENYNDDGIEYLDEPVDEIFGEYDDELAWADDITYLDEPEDEEFDLDLGEGFIPLPQGEVYQEELIVIDENYILDEYEEDLVENYERPAVIEEDYIQENYYSMDDIYNVLDDTDEIQFDFDDAESLIKFPIQQELEEELKVVNMSEEDDRLAKAIAKEHMENVKASDVAGGLFGDIENPEDDTSWVKDDEDIFGNDISVIIAEDPNNEIVEDDYAVGSFQNWLDQQNQ